VAGFVKKADVSQGGYRWLTVASPEDPDGTELQLARNDNPAARAYQEALFQQGQPAAMFFTDDVQGDYERMKDAGAEFKMAPTKVTGSLNVSVIASGGTGTALYLLGQVKGDQGHYAQACAYFAQSWALARRRGDSWTLLIALTRHSTALMEQGDLEQAAALAEESLALSRDALKDTWGTAWALCTLAQIAAWQGQTARAMALAEESLALFRELGNRWGSAAALRDLGLVARDRGDLARAGVLLDDSLALGRDLDDRANIAWALWVGKTDDAR